jgi:menaquinone-dependent protoporphyrinogen oxidase
MKVLVVFGSERGGTAGLARMIGTAFQRRGWTAEVRDAIVPGRVDADLVVVGGALYMNRWHSSARRFVRDHERELREAPVWLFSSGPLDDSARAGDIAPVAQVQAIASRLEAHGHMTFGGRLEARPKGMLARQMAKKMAGDWRDPMHCDEWVEQILREFVPTTIDLTVLDRPGMVVLPQQRTGSHAPADSPAAT